MTRATEDVVLSCVKGEACLDEHEKVQIPEKVGVFKMPMPLPSSTAQYVFLIRMKTSIIRLILYLSLSVFYQCVNRNTDLYVFTMKPVGCFHVLAKHLDNNSLLSLIGTQW